MLTAPPSPEAAAPKANDEQAPEAAIKAVPPDKMEAIDESRAVTDELVSDKARLREALSHYAVNQQAALRSLLERAPEPAKPAINRALNESIANYNQAIAALGQSEE
jgi:hypothetical protein